MSGAELREHAYGVLGSLQQIAATLWTRNRPSLKRMLESGLSMQVNSLGVASAFLPAEGFPTISPHLKVPFYVVATDFYRWSEVVFSEGPLRPAIAASMAIPSAIPAGGARAAATSSMAASPIRCRSNLVGSECRCADRRSTCIAPPTRALAVVEPSVLEAAIVAAEIMSEKLVDATVVPATSRTLYVRADVGPFRGQRILAGARDRRECERRQGPVQARGVRRAAGA